MKVWVFDSHSDFCNCAGGMAVGRVNERKDGEADIDGSGSDGPHRQCRTNSMTPERSNLWRLGIRSLILTVTICYGIPVELDVKLLEGANVVVKLNSRFCTRLIVHPLLIQKNAWNHHLRMFICPLMWCDGNEQVYRPVGKSCFSQFFCLSMLKLSPFLFPCAGSHRLSLPVWLFILHFIVLPQIVASMSLSKIDAALRSICLVVCLS